MPELNDIQLFNIRGRWGSKMPFACPPDQCIEALNVDFFNSTLARRRNGASSISLTGGTAQTGVISAIFSWVPGADETAREMFSVDDAATPRFKRLAAGTAWANVTVTDNVASRPVDMNAVQFNGKLFFFYDTTQNRLHCYDPFDAVLRRSGLGVPGTTGLAAGGAGANSWTRYYRARAVQLSGTVVRLISEPGTSSTITIAAKTGVTVSRPTLPGETETHWDVEYADAANGPWYRHSRNTVATASISDTDATIVTTNVSAIAGSHTLLPSAKFGVADDKYMVVGGAWESAVVNAGESTPSIRRAWWTSALGATDEGDDERTSLTSTIKSYTDFTDALTGMATPQQGSVLVFSYNGMSKLTQTGVAAAPYVSYKITGAKGCIRHQTIISAVDENEQPCTYWLSPQGPCRLGAGGQFSMVDDVSDIWELINLEATSAVAHGIYHRDKHQIWWFVATSGANDPNVRIVFDTRLGRVVDAGILRKGWAKHDGNSAAARCSCMMSNTLGASMSRDLKPYIGRSSGTAIWKCDTGNTDDGTSFQALLTSRPFTPAGLGTKSIDVKDATVSADASTGATISLWGIRGMGFETLTASSMSLTPAASESVIFAQLPAMVQDADCVQFAVGDASAASNPWNLHAVNIPASTGGEN